jgi:predicted AAA+ superfamily ATPase
LFETWVIGEVLKERWAAGEDGNLHYRRDHVGHEVDLLVPRGERLQPVEIKSGATLASDWFSGIHWWMEQAGERGISPALVYGGETAAIRTGVRVIPWSKLPEKLV